jgi:purine-binding chemotaxis protein CheW
MNNDTIQNQRQSIDGANAEPVVRTLQLFRAGPLQFGIFAEEIATIVGWREPTPLPHAPKSVLGVVSIQGRMLTVLDLATLSGDEAASSDARRDIPGHLIALRGDEQLALAVDDLGETVQLAEAEFDAKLETNRTLILGVLHHENAEINILNLKELFPAAIQGRERRRRRF